jgi:biotin carboxyl carrier protein
VYEFSVDGELIRVTLEYFNTGEVDFTVNNKTYYAAISKATDDLWKVAVNGKDFMMMRNDLLMDESFTSDQEKQGSSSDNLISAPIPGRIFKLNVNEGDTISKGDVVLVIDAMKMENNISSKRDGVVKKIMVKLNDMVDAGTKLIEIE